MKINWRERLKNKTFLISFTGLIIAFAYQALAMFTDSVPRIAEDRIVELVGMAVNVLAMLGVIVDPTTCGVCDSERALSYGTENDERLSEEEN